MKHNKTSFAYFGGGCFWCTESIFERLKGVLSVTSGYAGGTTTNPTYDEVSSGTTAHAEVIRVEFDIKIVEYSTLLDVFFSTHDPTTPNQQGHDRGSQYRSIILTNSSEQKKIAIDKIHELNQKKMFESDIVTEIKPLEVFYEAEEIHQRYFNKNQTAPYCQIVIFPKIIELKKQYSHLLK